MIEYRIRIEGAEKIERLLQKAPFILRKHLRRAMKKVGFGVQREAQRYPSPPPNSSYRRTGTLGRRWKSSVLSAGPSVKAIVENPTYYAPFVQGDDTQAGIHRGRWEPVGKIIKRLEGQTVQILEAAIAGAVKEMEG